MTLSFMTSHLVPRCKPDTSVDLISVLCFIMGSKLLTHLSALVQWILAHQCGTLQDSCSLDSHTSMQTLAVPVPVPCILQAEMSHCLQLKCRSLWHLVLTENLTMAITCRTSCNSLRLWQQVGQCQHLSILNRYTLKHVHHGLCD
jgi:hypothetical protein